MNALALAVLLHAGIPLSPPDVAGYTVIEDLVIATDSGSTRSTTQTTEISGDAIRRWTDESPMVLLVNAGPTGIAYAVADRKSRTWFGFDLATIASTGIGCPLMEGTGISTSGEIDAPATPFTATGTRTRVGGWDATEYTSTAPAPGNATTTWWVADKPDGLANAAMTSVLERVFSHRGSRFAAYFEGLAGIRGFPVKSVHRVARSGVTVTFTVRSIRATRFPDSHFRIPDGWLQSGDVGFDRQGSRLEHRDRHAERAGPHAWSERAAALCGADRASSGCRPALRVAGSASSR